MNILTGYLDAHFDEVPAMDFYRYIFPEGELDPYMKYTKGKYVGIAIEVMEGRKTKRHTITDNLEKVGELLRVKTSV